MASYSEVLQTMLAMVLFAIIMTISTKMMFMNSQHSVRSEAEKKAISIAQSYINKARILPFDNNTKSGTPSNIPEDFSRCEPEEGTNENTFDDFDDYHRFSETIDWYKEEDAFSVKIKVLYVSGPDYEIANGSIGSSSGDRTVFKKMQVSVSSQYLTDADGKPIEVTHSYLRRYY
ncbi:type IV pilus modification PilV family protein [Fodinibius halophilus]|uniref:Type II secretion system protein n=1 Tax=Fodinibius halophilus TaxID=1736908 RepID=A0A6M1THH7_9BACT|nr:hypothetical protein [Fodinibius halophilus]NGP90184.1 hypothetical protein [Fodinibius halophilus]